MNFHLTSERDPGDGGREQKHTQNRSNTNALPRTVDGHETFVLGPEDTTVFRTTNEDGGEAYIGYVSVDQEALPEGVGLDGHTVRDRQDGSSQVARVRCSQRMRDPFTEPPRQTLKGLLGEPRPNYRSASEELCRPRRPIEDTTDDVH